MSELGFLELKDDWIYCRFGMEIIIKHRAWKVIHL